MTFADQIWEFFIWLFPYLRGTTSIPGTVIQHPVLGSVTFEDEGWWRGQRRIYDCEIEFLVPDDGRGIDEIEAEECEQTLRSFDRILKKAVVKIGSELNMERDEVLSRFTPTHFWGFARYNEGSLFYLSFSDAEDEYKLWRVQFEKGQAMYVGYDD